MSVPTVSRIEELISLIEEYRHGRDPYRRILIAIAGPPGVGKTTLAGDLQQGLAASETVSMDGFHLDNQLLEQQGLTKVKGAPETFDVDGLSVLLQRIARDDGPIHIPVFDRDTDVSLAAARTIRPDHRIVLVEGNYLLLNEGRWAGLGTLFDLGILMQVPRDVLERRLISRWQAQNLDPMEARKRAQQNDLPNGDRVLAGSRAPEVYFQPYPV